MLVKELMTSKVQWVSPDLSIRECAQKMRELNVGALPVQENNQLLGIITDRDICCRAVADNKDAAATKAREIMSQGITSCFDEQDCSDAAHLMEDRHIRRLPVLDKGKHMVGFLSVGDLARCSHDLAGEVLEATAGTAH